MHRGVLVHLLVAYPGWRPRSPGDVVAVAVGYLAAVVVPVWQNEAATVALRWRWRRSPPKRHVSAGPLRRARRTALVGTVMFAGALLTGTLIRLIGGDDAVTSSRLVYELALCLVEFWLTADSQA